MSSSIINRIAIIASLLLICCCAVGKERLGWKGKSFVAEVDNVTNFKDCITSCMLAVPVDRIRVIALGGLVYQSEFVDLPKADYESDSTTSSARLELQSALGSH